MKIIESKKRLWAVALVAPLISLLALQLLGALGIKLTPSIKDPDLSLVLLMTIVLGPSYLIFLLQPHDWRQRLRSVAIFSPIALVYVLVMPTLFIFSACYVFHRCM